MVTIGGKKYDTFKGQGGAKKKTDGDVPNKNAAAIRRIREGGQSAPRVNAQAVAEASRVQTTETVVVPASVPGGYPYPALWKTITPETPSRIKDSNPVIFQQSQMLAQRATTPPVAVASYQKGVDIYRASDGELLIPTASYEQDGVLLTPAPEPKVKLSSRRLPQDGAQFATPGLALSDRRRKDIIKAGEFLVENANAPGLLGAERTKLGRNLRLILGTNLQEFGYNPKQYVVENVVLPSEGGAIVGGILQSGIKATPLVLRSVGLSTRAAAKATGLLEAGLVVGGGAALVEEVKARGPEGQRPDIIFSVAGGVAGAKAGELKPLKGDTEFYGLPGGRPKPPSGRNSRYNRAARLDLPTQTKPTSKAELRKQSLGQSYNPQQYLKANEAGVRYGGGRKQEIEYLRILSKDQVELGRRSSVPELGIPRQKVEQSIRYDPRALATLGPKSGFKQEPRFFIESTGKDYGPQTKLPGVGKRQRAIDFYGKEIQLGNQKGILTQRFDLLKGFEPSKQRSLTFSETIKVDPRGQIPQYELVPNAPQTLSRYNPNSPFYKMQELSRAGFRYRRGGGRVLNFRPDVQTKPGRELVVFSNEYPIQVVPSKDIALNRELASYGLTSTSSGPLSTPFYNPPTTRPFRILEYPIPTPSLARNVFSTPTQKQPQIVTPLPSIKIDSGQEQNNRLVPLEKTDFIQDTKPEQNQELQPAQIPVQDQEEETIQIIDLDLGGGGGRGGGNKKPLPPPPQIIEPVPPPPPIPRPIPPPRPIPKPRIEAPPEPPNFPTIRFPTEKIPRGASFKVSIGRKGNKYFFDLGTGGIDKIFQARKLARTTAAASINIVPLNPEARSFDILGTLGKEFSLGKKGRFVQKTSTRISSPGEKIQIPGEARSRRLTKGSSTRKAFNLVGKGISLRAARWRLKL